MMGIWSFQLPTSWPCNFGSEFDIGQARQPTPDDNDTGRWIAGPGEVSAQAGELGQVEGRVCRDGIVDCLVR